MSVPILSSIFGDKPNIAPFKKIDYGASQLKSILENLKAFPQIQALGDYFQKYMTDAYNKAIPNFSDLLEMGGKTSEEILKAAQPLIHGEIPEDVKGQIMRSGAFQALGKGADFLHSLQARDLGRTSIDLMGIGDTMAKAAGSATQQWAGLASGLIMNPAGFLVTPAQQANLDLQQSLIQREVQQARENVNAAPNPIAKGLSDLVAYLTASYIGRGPAGKPPEATNYSSATNVRNATDVSGTDFYGLSSFGTQPSSVANPQGLGTQGNLQAPAESAGGPFGGITGWNGSVDLPPSVSQNDVNQVNNWDPYANSISTYNPGYSGFEMGPGYPSSTLGTNYYGGSTSPYLYPPPQNVFNQVPTPWG